MKVTIDEKTCIKHGLSFQEAVIGFAVRNMDKKVVDNMFKREILVKQDGRVKITARWNDVLEEIICDSSGSVTDEKRLENLAKQMRDCFPEGKMPGTAYYYRCNNKEVIQKLKKFFLQYGNYTDDQIIDATKRFVASFRGNYRFLPLIKYFISKLKPVQEEDGSVHNVEYSPLADFLENNEGDGGESSNDDSWLVHSRN